MKKNKKNIITKLNIIYLMIFILLVSSGTFYIKNNFTVAKFQVKNISIDGYKHIAHKDIEDKLNYVYNKNILFLNPWAIRKKLNELTMVADVKVIKKFPNTLNVNITERKPLLIMTDNNKHYLLDNEMKLINIEKNMIENYPILKNLTYVEGNNIAQDASNMVTLFSEEKIKNRISALYRINNRRWDMIIDKKIKLMLPESVTSEFVTHAFHLIDSFKSNNSINPNAFYSIIDMRVKDKVFIKNITN